VSFQRAQESQSDELARELFAEGPAQNLLIAVAESAALNSVGRDSTFYFEIAYSSSGVWLEFGKLRCTEFALGWLKSAYG
jgi:hypothetical protein